MYVIIYNLMNLFKKKYNNYVRHFCLKISNKLVVVALKVRGQKKHFKTNIRSRFFV